MQCVTYFDWQELPPPAPTLLDHTSIFCSRTWFAHISTTLDVNQRLVLVAVIRDNLLLALLPLVQQDNAIWHALYHRYSPHYSMLLVEFEREQVLICLTEGLSQLYCHALLLEPIIDDDRNMQDFQQALETAGYTCQRLFRHYNWVYPVQRQTYRDYLATRPSRLQQTLTRKIRKLQREHDIRLRLSNTPEALADYHAIYAASWKANEQYVAFINTMVEKFSKNGWTRLGILYANNQPIAAQLWFVRQHQASIFRLAYDQSWKQYSPGTMLTAWMMEQVIDKDNATLIDFLTGNEVYKQDWMSARRTCVALSCIKPKTRPEWWTRWFR
jgi:hypothetical protein